MLKGEMFRASKKSGDSHRAGDCHLNPYRYG